MATWGKVVCFSLSNPTRGFFGGLGRGERERKREKFAYTNDKVEVCQIGANVREAIVEDKDVENTVQVQEQQTICKAVVKAEEDDNGLSDHDPQGHG